MKSELKVEGMHCKSCAMLIEDSLTEFDSVKNVSIDVEAGKVKVEYDENNMSEEKIAQLIITEGFKVKKNSKKRRNERK